MAQGGVEHSHGERAVPVEPAKGDLMPGDHDDTGVRRPPLHPDRLGRRAWWWPGGVGATQPLTSSSVNGSARVRSSSRVSGS
jgi:hypothetical protein